MGKIQKEILSKNEYPTIRLQNYSGKPNIVLVMPITRNEEWSISKWQAAMKFMENSAIATLIIVDKTTNASATKFFMENFNLVDRNLYILPRSISESHYESLGSIRLDDNSWVMQLHDDDDWRGFLAVPEFVDPKTAYYPRFFIKNSKGVIKEEQDFSNSARINFALTPAHIWNKFALLVQDQKFHVAGSLDSTLNLMVQLTCSFKPIPSFEYFYDNRHWSSRQASTSSLIKLAEIDGWGGWTSIDIALLSRQMDNLSCLNYIVEFVAEEDLNNAYTSLIKSFKPRFRRRAYIRLKGFFIKAAIGVGIPALIRHDGATLNETLRRKLSTISLIQNSWSVSQLSDAIELARKLQLTEDLTKLHSRFQFWQASLLNLSITMCM